MSNFNLKNHLEENFLLFNEIDSLRFFDDINNLAQVLSLESEVILLKESDPYQFLITFFAILINKKTPLLVNDKFTPLQIESIKKNVHFTNKIILPTKTNQLHYNIKLDQQFFLLSSGSTGEYKIIVHHFNNILEHLKMFNSFFNPKKNETYLLNLPLYHVSGLMLFFRSFLNFSKIKTTFDEKKIDYLSLVPSQLEVIFKSKQENIIETLSKAKGVFVGGANLNHDLKNKLSANKISFYETYGMTETLSFICLNNKILNGVSISTDSNGLVSIYSPTLFLGQIINHSFIPRDNPYQTSDVGQIKDDCFYFNKRIDQLINSGGEKISLQYIQNEIFKLNIFEKFHVTSVKDKKWNEKVICFYQNAFDEDFKNVIKKHLNNIMNPKDFITFDFSQIENRKISKLEWNQYYLDQIFNYQYFDHTQEKTIVVFNGFMESMNDWFFLIEHFKNKFNLLYIALPGHDLTSTNSFFDTDDLVIKLSEFIKSKNIDPIFLGYSQGGRIALALAQYFSHANFLIISSSLGLEDENEKRVRLANDLKLFDDVHTPHDLFSFFTKWYKNPIFGNYNLFSSYQDDIQAKLNKNYKNWSASLALLSIGNFPTMKERLDQIHKDKNNIIYIYGELDKKYSAFSKYLTSYPIKNAYHNLHRTHQNELIALLKRLL